LHLIIVGIIQRLFLALLIEYINNGANLLFLMTVLHKINRIAIGYV
jgi:hypothetical protein